MESASYLGGQPGQIAVLVVGVVMLRSRRRRWAVALPLVMAGVGVVQAAAKWVVARPRPNLDPLGFPSAHVLSLVVLCGFLAYAVSTGSARRRQRHLLAGACAAVVGTVAYSRMYLDAHWLSDILGGVTAGLGYLLIAIWVVRSSPRWERALRGARAVAGADGGLIPIPVGSPAGSMAPVTIPPAGSPTKLG
jgi:undecaprenyl-diphosphatase